MLANGTLMGGIKQTTAQLDLRVCPPERLALTRHPCSLHSRSHQTEVPKARVISSVSDHHMVEDLYAQDVSSLDQAPGELDISP